MLMAVITCSGILIVFMILLLLILIFYAYGGIFGAFTASKAKKLAAKKAAEEAAKAKSAPAQTAPLPVHEPADTDDGSIPGEIIAVIAAAVASMSEGKRYAIKKVARAQKQTGVRSAWATSGVYENTRPF